MVQSCCYSSIDQAGLQRCRAVVGLPDAAEAWATAPSAACALMPCKRNHRVRVGCSNGGAGPTHDLAGADPLRRAAVLFWTACLLSSCVAGASRGEDTAYLARETVRLRAASPHDRWSGGWQRPLCSAFQRRSVNSRCAVVFAVHTRAVVGCLRPGGRNKPATCSHQFKPAVVRWPH